MSQLPNVARAHYDTSTRGPLGAESHFDRDTEMDARRGHGRKRGRSHSP